VVTSAPSSKWSVVEGRVRFHRCVCVRTYCSKGIDFFNVRAAQLAASHRLIGIMVRRSRSVAGLRRPTRARALLAKEKSDRRSSDVATPPRATRLRL